MKRRIIEINREKCNGCGLCVDACHEGAIGLVHGKAQLMRDDYCDGLGDCLPNCPTSAISFIEKETVPYDEQAVKAHMDARKLQNWPVQIKLAAPNAPYFQDCDLLIAADCTAYAYAGFHERFVQNRVTVIGCPKLDNIDYSVKLAAILQLNTIRSITVTRMEVPCCGGLTAMVEKAVAMSGKQIPVHIQTISIDGKLL